MRPTSIVATALALALPTISWGASYTITDLGAPNTPRGINDSGQVTGGGGFGCFVYSNGVFQYLGSPPGEERVGGGDINSSGQIVANGSRTFLYSAGDWQDLGSLGGGEVFGTAINSSGVIVGYSTISDAVPYRHGFVYSGGVMQDLGSLGGIGSTTAVDINDTGAIVGTSSMILGGSHAFLNTAGVMHDLGALGGAVSSATGINQNGEIVGYSYLPNGVEYHAFLYSGGVMRDLGTLPSPFNGFSSASDINDSGQIVGASYNEVGSDRPFLYSGGAMYDLNSLIDPSSGWRLRQAYAINHNGQIIGYGDFNFGRHGFLLTPVPEPSSFVLAALGLIGLAPWGWRRKRGG